MLGQQDLRIERQHAARGVTFRQMHGRVAALQTGAQRQSIGHGDLQHGNTAGLGRRHQGR